eukprot:scaffold25960_cov53-Phaeocystis_antarctica.AAC.1
MAVVTRPWTTRATANIGCDGGRVATETPPLRADRRRRCHPGPHRGPQADPAPEAAWPVAHQATAQAVLEWRLRRAKRLGRQPAADGAQSIAERSPATSRFYVAVSYDLQRGGKPADGIRTAGSQNLAGVRPARERA